MPRAHVSICAAGTADHGEHGERTRTGCPGPDLGTAPDEALVSTVGRRRNRAWLRSPNGKTVTEQAERRAARRAERDAFFARVADGEARRCRVCRETDSSSFMV
jgi:hypothetical protein